MKNCTQHYARLGKIRGAYGVFREGEYRKYSPTNTASFSSGAASAKSFAFASIWAAGAMD